MVMQKEVSKLTLNHHKDDKLGRVQKRVEDLKRIERRLIFQEKENFQEKLKTELEARKALQESSNKQNGLYQDFQNLVARPWAKRAAKNY